MIKINLLPHREKKREQRKKAFYSLLIFSAVAGLFVILVVSLVIGHLISLQENRNTLIRTENQKLDEQIKEIATLQQEIDALKARQQAVEDLQSDRNKPVHVFDELTKQVPEGIYLKSFKQDGQRILLNGYAQSNERVSELLRNLTNASEWLKKPELIEIKAVTIGQGKDFKKIFEFSMNVDIQRPDVKDTKDAKDMVTPQPAENVPVPATQTPAKS